MLPSTESLEPQLHNGSAPSPASPPPRELQLVIAGDVRVQADEATIVVGEIKSSEIGARFALEQLHVRTLTMAFALKVLLTNLKTIHSHGLIITTRAAESGNNSGSGGSGGRGSAIGAGKQTKFKKK
uniref:Uncharacterized protein n=1 Tax=Ditylenchus dipsaci TaxID=166011 RepID=A0A915CZU9_9BILA